MVSHVISFLLDSKKGRRIPATKTGKHLHWEMPYQVRALGSPAVAMPAELWLVCISVNTVDSPCFKQPLPASPPSLDHWQIIPGERSAKSSHGISQTLSRSPHFPRVRSVLRGKLRAYSQASTRDDKSAQSFRREKDGPLATKPPQ